MLAWNWELPWNVATKVNLLLGRLRPKTAWATPATTLALPRVRPFLRNKTTPAGDVVGLPPAGAIVATRMYSIIRPWRRDCVTILSVVIVGKGLTACLKTELTEL